MCMTHHYARMTNPAGRIIYRCVDCAQEVDWMAARDEYDRQQLAGEAPASDTIQYDPTAGMIETPAGLAKFVAYDPNEATVTVEVDWLHLVRFPAAECFLPMAIGGRGAA